MDRAPEIRNNKRPSSNRKRRRSSLGIAIAVGKIGSVCKCVFPSFFLSGYCASIDSLLGRESQVHVCVVYCTDMCRCLFLFFQGMLFWNNVVRKMMCYNDELWRWSWKIKCTTFVYDDERMLQEFCSCPSDTTDRYRWNDTRRVNGENGKWYTFNPSRASWWMESTIKDKKLLRFTIYNLPLPR